MLGRFVLLYLKNPEDPIIITMHYGFGNAHTMSHIVVCYFLFGIMVGHLGTSASPKPTLSDLTYHTL